MSETTHAAGTEYFSEPYLLDASAAEAYLRAIEAPRRRRAANIHNDPEAARKAGYRAPIAAGEHSLAILANLLVDHFGFDFLRGGKLDVAFIKPVLYGDRLTAHARVTEIAAGSAQLDVWVENDTRERVLTGTAAVSIR